MSGITEHVAGIKASLDPWNKLNESRRLIYQKGEAAAKVLRKYESIERWHEIGQAADALMHDAMTYSGSNVASGKGYNSAWNQLASHVPNVRDLDKAARSASVWMAQNWELVDRWLNTLSAAERLQFNHPAVVRRKFDAATKPQKPQSLNVKPRITLQDKVTELRETLDKKETEISALKASQNEPWPQDIPSEEYARRLHETRTPIKLRELINELQKLIDTSEPQIAKVSKPKRQRKPKAKLIQNDSARQEHDIEATGANETVATRE